MWFIILRISQSNLQYMQYLILVFILDFLFIWEKTYWPKKQIYILYLPLPPISVTLGRSLSPKIFYVYKELIIQASLIQSAYEGGDGHSLLPYILFTYISWFMVGRPMWLYLLAAFLVCSASPTHVCIIYNIKINMFPWFSGF